MKLTNDHYLYPLSVLTCHAILAKPLRRLASIHGLDTPGGAFVVPADDGFRRRQTPSHASRPAPLLTSFTIESSPGEPGIPAGNSITLSNFLTY
jgi:hypothetical protein